MNPRDALARALIEQKSGQVAQPAMSMGFSRPVTYKSYDSADAAAAGNGTPFLQIGAQTQMQAQDAQADPSMGSMYVPTKYDLRLQPHRGDKPPWMLMLENKQWDDRAKKEGWERGSWVSAPREKPATYALPQGSRSE